MFNEICIFFSNEYYMSISHIALIVNMVQYAVHITLQLEVIYEALHLDVAEGCRKGHLMWLKITRVGLLV